MRFREFVEGKNDTAKKLALLKRMFKKMGFKGVRRGNGKLDEPFLFLFPPEHIAPFGLRIYEVAGQVAYRLQKKPKTQPWGRAYPLSLEEMFREAKEEAGDDHGAIKAVMHNLKELLRDFLRKSYKAQKEDSPTEDSEKRDPLGKVVVAGNYGTDYADMVTNRSF